MKQFFFCFSMVVKRFFPVSVWILLAGMMLLPCMAAKGASPSAPAYRSLQFLAWYPWTDGLGVKFNPDEKICRARYGNNWESKCAAALGEAGETVEGVVLTPFVKGHWQWADSNSMDFVPDSGAVLSPGTTYTVDVSGMNIPSSVKLEPLKLSITTEELSVRIRESRFWADPSPQAKHRLAVTLEFNYPVGKTSPEISCTAPGVQFGEAEMVWNSLRDQVNISFPVDKLPEQNTEAQILVKNVPSFTFENGNLEFHALPKGARGTLFRANITGRKSLFTVNTGSLDEELDEQLNKSYVLSLETSLYTTPEEVLKNLDVWQLPRFASPEAARPCNWIAAPAVSSKALAESRKLTPVPLMKDNAPVSRLRFRIPADPDSYILVGINEKCSSSSGLAMGKTWRKILRVNPHNASLDFLQPGHILSLSGKKLLDIYATGLNVVRWEAQLVREPFLALLAQGSDTAFTEPLANAGVGIGALSESFCGEIPLKALSSSEAQFAVLDLSSVLSGKSSDAHGLMKITLKGVKGGEEVTQVSRMVLVTDIGMMLKRTALGGYDAFVHSFRDGKPVPLAKVSILGANGKPVASAQTDNRGHASFPSLNGLKRESRPVAAV
ncbi:MAG: hypothetical protein ACI4P0_00285, partial [Mailhella sp.]